MALPFLEQRMDDAVSRGMRRIKTVPGRTLRYGPTGALAQNFSAALPIHRYDVVPGIKTIAQFQTVEALWYVVNFGADGPYAGFRLKDWGDYKLNQANSSLTFVDADVDYWQLNRIYLFGGAAAFVRPISKPNAGVVIKRNRSGVISTASAAVDTTNGHVTISGHVGGDTYTAEGTFDVPVTFSDNEWDAEINGGQPNLIEISGRVRLEELRL